MRKFVSRVWSKFSQRKGEWTDGEMAWEFGVERMFSLTREGFLFLFHRFSDSSVVVRSRTEFANPQMASCLWRFRFSVFGLLGIVKQFLCEVLSGTDNLNLILISFWSKGSLERTFDECNTWKTLEREFAASTLSSNMKSFKSHVQSSREKKR